jgi:hypothetical protein
MGALANREPVSAIDECRVPNSSARALRTIGIALNRNAQPNGISLATLLTATKGTE